MASIALRPGRRTYYLDTSTLSYAFRGGNPKFRYDSDPAEFADLHELVQSIAREDNLCVSLMHFKELGQWPKSDELSAFVEWIDAIDFVTMYGCDQVQALEDQRALQLAVGVSAPSPVALYAPSLLTAFRTLQMTEAAEALHGGGRALPKLLAAAHTLGGERERQHMAELQQTFHFDRNLDPATRGLTDADKQTIVAHKLRETLMQEGRDAMTVLRGVDLADFHARCRAIADVPAVFADFVLANPTSMPAWYIGREFSSRFAEVAARRTPGSKKAKALESSFYDWAHAVVGGGYCDVFTCDVLTLECLAGAREALGRSTPIAYDKADASALVKALASA